jgi:hypothetical protein
VVHVETFAHQGTLVLTERVRVWPVKHPAVEGALTQNLMPITVASVEFHALQHNSAIMGRVSVRWATYFAMEHALIKDLTITTAVRAETLVPADRFAQWEPVGPILM